MALPTVYNLFDTLRGDVKFDVAALSAVLSGQTRSANGLFAGQGAFGLVFGKNGDGTTLAATPAAGVFGLTQSLGTSTKLTGEDASAAAKTDIAMWEYTLPSNYVAGSNLTVTYNGKVNGTLAGGDTHTAEIKAYKVADVGTHGADISTHAATALTGSDADYAATVTGTTLSPGDTIIVSLTTVVTEVGGGTINSLINSVRLS